MLSSLIANLPLVGNAVGGVGLGGAEVIFPALFLIPFIPLLGAVLTYTLTARSKGLHGLSGWIATGAALGSFLVVLSAFKELTANPETLALSYKAWSWIVVPPLHVDFAFRFDNLTAVMCLVVTGIGSLIHLYAIGYMAEDESRPRFFCYLNLFLFSMLLLVLGRNLLVMFVGWEGVGLCSYLLIGFWNKEMGNTIAGQKAFVLNRIGDAGFLLGMFLLFQETRTIDFMALQLNMGFLSPGAVELAALLLFVGAVGKSAQIPLFVWLPDAMAGPTPVSALIHAATMVTAGVYMIARMSFLFAEAHMALSVIVVIGTCTAFLAATIALVQNDIKKVLAYSTVSQLGYMFMAMGSGAFSNGIYHVVTHAFFKACLFMGAGSVIMGCHHEQDMRHFGGLWKKMPFTFATYLCAVLAIAGLPPFSGYFSKDAILWAVYSNEHLPGAVMGVPVTHMLWGVGVATAFLTAFYMTRSLMLTFFGEYRGHAHPHESPWVVWVPLVVLAVPSLFFGLVFGEQFMHFLAAWTRGDILALHHHPEPAVVALEHTLAMVSSAIAVMGVGLAVFVYGIRPAVAAWFSRVFPGIYSFLLDKWRVDELYHGIIVRPLSATAAFVFSAIDRSLVDGLVNGTGMLVEANGDVAKRMHTGRISQYALWMFLGNLALIVFWLLVR